ncbi:glycoside hydrolase family 5 protein [Flavobacterium piscis]|uniref:Aryl-phospho-beta-D-glucosidase BglC (GH1 family) n=1 Tax=Flavobacterium piscis TaxID=1114874 RepID=A0ABU1Y6L0_9FLAO|nr:glycoside hydrolase family 5 protein [Flavobacterium piscis]MDR7209870.1 aryl-phospho-beta-D-glucosidase BglC (GH1 family) [Flavobacterium piscis]
MRKSIKSFIIVTGLLISANVWSQLPKAQEIAKRMHVGWNLGNTLEAICDENAWGAGKTSQKLIDSVKAAGFNTVRIPVSWFCHSDTISNKINKKWIARVKEVVDYCIKDDLYVIINMHWDKGWLENRINAANQEEVNKRQYIYWTQIAKYFKNYDEHLLFAGANEPNAANAAQLDILMSYYQTFVDAVRATGGNNASRTIIVQGPETNIEKTLDLMNSLPKDKIQDRMMVEVHYYTPFQFCLMEKEAAWGKPFYYWGKDNHSETDVEHNATWGEEAMVDKLFSDLKTKYVDKGIPVILGEFGAYKRKLSAPSDQALNERSVEFFGKYVVKSALENGIIPYYWDTPNNLFNRDSGQVLDRGVLKAMMDGAKEAKKK